MRAKKFLFLTLLTLTLAQFAPAQVSFEASVDKTEVDLKDDINLTLVLDVKTTNVGPVQMPSLPNFNIYSADEARTTALAPGGGVNVQHIYRYILSPRFAGASSISPFTVTVDGKEYRTQPLAVTVRRSGGGNAAASLAKRPAPKAPAPAPKAPTAAPAQKPDFFMTAELSKKEAWLNEQVNLKIRFYQAKRTVGNAQYTKPKTEGLVFEELSTSQGEEAIAGKRYIYNQFDNALFGLLPGAAQIGAAAVDYSAPSVMGDVFDIFFAGAGSAQRVSTEPLEVNIKPLPKEGRPASFYGAVGAGFAINADVDSAAPAAGSPVQYTLTIEGIGNMKAIGDMPPPALGADFRVYDSSASITPRVSGGVVGGRKVFSTIIVPRVSGKFTIPAAEFSYFDIEEGRYRTITGGEIVLDVAPAPEGAGAPAVFTSAQAPAVQQVNAAIAYLKDDRRAPRLSAVLRFFAPTWPAPLAVILGVFIYLFVKKRAVKIKIRPGAGTAALKGLKRAKDMGEISQVLAAYLAAKAGPGLSVEAACKKLRLPAKTAKELDNFWQALEMLKYAPAAMVAGKIAVDEAKTRAQAIIREVERI